MRGPIPLPWLRPRSSGSRNLPQTRSHNPSCRRPYAVFAACLIHGPMKGRLLLGCSYSDVLHFEALVAGVGNRVVDADFVISATGLSTAAGVEALRCLGRFEVEIELRVAVCFTIELDLHRIDPGRSGTGEDHAEIDVGGGLADGQLEFVEGPWR